MEQWQHADLEPQYAIHVRAKTVEVKQRDTFAQDKMYFNANTERTKTGLVNLSFYSMVTSKYPHLPQMGYIIRT